MVVNWSRLLRRRPASWSGASKTMRLPEDTGGRRAFAFRDTLADTKTIDQIFRNGQFSIVYLRRGAEIRSFYDDVVAQGRTPLILDAGSHIGASAVYFSHSYPKSQVVCFEPEPGNFALLRDNTKGLDVELHQAGIGAADGVASLVDPGEGSWGYRTAAAPPRGTDTIGEASIKGIAGVTTAKVAQGYVPFIVKIDIEGGEADLFDAPCDWLDAFPVLMIELHDYLMPKKGVSRGFLAACASRDRDFIYKGEMVFSIDNAMDASAALGRSPVATHSSNVTPLRVRRT